MSMSELNDNINPYLMETDYKLYHQNLLKAIRTQSNASYLRHIMNDTTNHHSFNSPAIMQLAYMVGVLVKTDPNIDYYTFYGKNSTISDEEGCLMLETMIQAGADIYVENFYEENILECLQSNRLLTSRKNNQNFKLKIEKLFQTIPPPVRKGKGRDPPPNPPLAG